MTQSDQTSDATEPSAHISDLKVGSVLAGRYRILRRLGEGAMGSVYLAEHLSLGRGDAIKVLRESLAHDAEALARFHRGAQKVSKLRHENVCAVYDFSDTPDGVQFLAMEYVPGRTLKDVLEAEPTLPLQRVLPITLQVASALQAAHDSGIVHGDLKPANIMLMRGAGGTELVKVVDFDIARTQGDLEHSEVTGTGFVIGTPEYMSPEQLFGEVVDARSDVYSLAVVVHRMLTGRLPFPGENTREMLVSRLTNPPLTLGQSLPNLVFPPDLQPVLGAAMRASAAERTPTAEAFARALTEAAGRITPHQDAIFAAEPTRRVSKPQVGATAPTTSLFTPTGILSPSFPPSVRPASVYTSLRDRFRIPFASASVIAIALLTWGAWSVTTPVGFSAPFEAPVLEAKPGVPVPNQALANNESLIQKKSVLPENQEGKSEGRTAIARVTDTSQPRSAGAPANDTRTSMRVVQIPAPTTQIGSPAVSPPSLEQPTGIRFQNVQNAITDQMRAVLMISSTGVAPPTTLVAIRDTAEAAWTSSSTETERAKSAYILGSVFFHLKDRNEGLKWSRRALAHCEQAVAEPDTTIKSCESYRLLVELFELSRGG